MPWPPLLVFAHTIGEFGVVMMLGGGIPGQTEVLSIEIHRLVETLEWTKAHLWLAALLVFAFLAMLSLLLMERRGFVKDVAGLIQSAQNGPLRSGTSPWIVTRSTMRSCGQ